MMTTDQLYESARPFVHNALKWGRRRYPFVEAEDLEQELWCYIYGEGKEFALRQFVSGTYSSIDRRLREAVQAYASEVGTKQLIDGKGTISFDRLTALGLY